MKRLAWFAGLVLVAAGFVVGRMTGAHEVAARPAAVPASVSIAAPVLTAAAVRDIVREELAAIPRGADHASPSPAAPAAQHEAEAAVGALDNARAVLAERMADGHWTDDDRNALREAMTKLNPAQTREILSTLFPAINSGQLKLDAVDGPL